MKKIFALVLALALAVCVLPVMAEEAAVMTHDEYIAAEMNSEVCVETYVTNHQGWWENNGVGVMSIYAQSEDGAYFIYEMPMSKEQADALVPGTKIRVTGVKSEYHGEVEIAEATFEVLEADPFVAEAEDLTAKLGSDELINDMNKLASFKGLTVVAKTDAEGNEAAFLYKWDGTGAAGNNDDLYFDASIDGQTYTFTVESYLCGQDTDVYKAVEGLQVGDVIDIEGFMYWYDGPNVQVTAVTPAAAE